MRMSYTYSLRLPTYHPRTIAYYPTSPSTDRFSAASFCRTRVVHLILIISS
jgi:hypothetical protein